MKMNKIIIPVAALAMGVALVGSVSSTLAWYQYSTKAQAAFIGTSVGESENLEIKDKDGNWKSNLTSEKVNGLISNLADLNVIPITPALTAASASYGNNVALPEHFFTSVETGVAGFDTYGERYASTNNYVSFTLELRYRKTAYKDANNPDSLLAKKVNLVDLTIVDDAGDQGAVKDLYTAVRVHFATGEGASAKYSLFARDESTGNVITTATYGSLDTDNDGHLDKKLGYEWETDLGDNLVYGVDGSTQTSFNANKSTGIAQEIGTIPADGTLKVNVTIWLEGWQKLSGIPTGNADTTSSAMWDPATYVNKHFKVGMRFQAVEAE